MNIATVLLKMIGERQIDDFFSMEEAINKQVCSFIASWL
jgi:hypothetical protein